MLSTRNLNVISIQAWTYLGGLFVCSKYKELYNNIIPNFYWIMSTCMLKLKIIKVHKSTSVVVYLSFLQLKINFRLSNFSLKLPRIHVGLH